MKHCPHCKGINGFEYRLTIKSNRSGSWGVDNDEETQIERTSTPKNVVCVDCGKRVEFNKAHGVINSVSLIYSQ